MTQIRGGGEHCVTPARAAAKETPILSSDIGFVPKFWGVPVFFVLGHRTQASLNCEHSLWNFFKEKGKKACPIAGSFLVSSRNAPLHGSVTLPTMTCMIIDNN